MVNVTHHEGCTSPHAEASEFDQNSWIIAICLAILAAVSNNLGVNFQKLAWTQMQRGTASATRYKIVWLLGMLGIVLASVFDFVALAFGPQSVIAPIGALTIVMNGCVASYLHGERVTRTILVTSIVICAGCALAVATASHVNVICDLDGIFLYFQSAVFAGYCVFMGVLTLAVHLAALYAERVFKRFGECSNEYGKIFSFHRISYAFLAGLFGSVSVVFARAIGQLVMSSSRGGDLFLVRWETYLILLALIVSIVLQIVNLNKGLSRFESSYNVPTFTGTFIVAVAVSGGVVYGEFAGFSLESSILFPLGVLLCVAGVFALTWNADKLGAGDDKTTLAVDDTSAPGGDHLEDQTSPQPPPPAATSGAGSRRSSLKIHSGGFSPFVLAVDDVMDEHKIRSRSHSRAKIDLLTGLYIDENRARRSTIPASMAMPIAVASITTSQNNTPRNSQKLGVINPNMVNEMLLAPTNTNTMATRSGSPANAGGGRSAAPSTSGLGFPRSSSPAPPGAVVPTPQNGNKAL